MSIKATCTCGAEFKAKPELAGKPVKCPKCGQTFTVPKPQPSTSRIQVTCQCGKALQAKPELAGKRVKCPDCGGVLQVPDPQLMNDRQPEQASSGGLDLQSLAAMEHEAEVQGTFPPLPDREPVGTSRGADPAADQARRAVAQDALKRAESELQAEESRRRAVTWWPLSPKLKVCAIVTASCIALGGLLGLVIPAIGMFFVVSAYLVIGLAGVIGGIWLLIVAFEEDLVCGLLYLFVPFYSLYYLVTRWENSPPFLLIVGQIPAFFLVFLYATLLGAVVSVSEPGVARQPKPAIEETVSARKAGVSGENVAARKAAMEEAAQRAAKEAIAIGEKLTGSDCAAGDRFGSSVSLSGNSAVAGAPWHDGVFTDTGATYVFERAQRGSGDWVVAKKLLPSDAASGNRFGNSVAISGDTLAIGSPCDDARGADSGSAHVLERNQGGAGNWGEVRKLTASDASPSDWFGYRLDLDGDTLIVGAWRAGANQGAVYVFSRNHGGLNKWGEAKKLVAADPQANDQFGRSAAVDGDTVVVGAYQYGAAGPGKVYIFERNHGGLDNWGQVKKLMANDGAADDNFGGNVAISGNTAVIGNTKHDFAGNNAGAVYIYERNRGGPNNWGLVKKSGSDRPSTPIRAFPKLRPSPKLTLHPKLRDPARIVVPSAMSLWQMEKMPKQPMTKWRMSRKRTRNRQTCLTTDSLIG